jgi:hypothetical protein
LRQIANLRGVFNQHWVISTAAVVVRIFAGAFRNENIGQVPNQTKVLLFYLQFMTFTHTNSQTLLSPTSSQHPRPTTSHRGCGFNLKTAFIAYRLKKTIRSNSSTNL